jgi:hypothetical protein
MTQRRVTATRQLSTVINVIQLGKKTGLLTVERGEGKTLEEGTMAFLQGQIVNATLGTLQGRDAAGALSAWQACHFSFVEKQPHELGASAPLSSAQQASQSQQYSPAAPMRSARPATPPPSDAYFSQNGFTSGELPVTQPNQQSYQKPPTQPMPPIQSMSPMQPTQNNLLGRRPRTTFHANATDSVIQVMDRQGYSRLHRRLLLLIDGRRTILELSNLIGHPLDETLILLTDLERAGIINQ